jgi:hypothetical protein
MKTKLLAVFRAKVEHNLSAKPELYSVDRALLCLLEEFEKNLPELDNYFHKAFRQVDVTDSGRIDAAIWQLIGLSDTFWEAFDEVTENKFVS